MDALRRELRHALRSLLRNPGFAAVVVACLGLGLGLTTAMYGVLDAVLLPRVPYAAPEEVSWLTLEGRTQRPLPSLWERYLQLRDGTRFHQGVALEAPRPAVVEVRGQGEEYWGAAVTPNYFTLLGARPVTGRLFNEASVLAGDAGGVVVSYRLWQRLLGARTDLDQLSLSVDGVARPVIGVADRDMPRGQPMEFWIPIDRPSTVRWGRIVARRAPSATVASAQRELDATAARLELDAGRGGRPLRYSMEPATALRFRFGQMHVLMAGAVIAVLLIACANVANLVLARGIARRRDFALRVALGGSRARLVREQLVEGGVLALAGGALGALLAVWGMRIVASRIPQNLRLFGFIEPQLSWRVFAFSVLASLATVAVFGLIPALRASRADPNGALKDSAGTTTGRSRGRYNVLVIGEVAGSIVLLMAAVLLVKAARRDPAHRLTFDARDVVTTQLQLRTQQFPDGDQVARTFDRALADARAAGAVAAATHSVEFPEGGLVTVDVAGGGLRETALLALGVVSSEYFRALGRPVIEGRDFAPGDASAGDAVIVNRALAKHLWPRGEWVGRRVKFGDRHGAGRWLRVVGVVENSVDDEIRSEWDAIASGAMYVISSHADSSRRRQIVARASPGGSARLAVALREALDRVVPSTAVRSVRPYLAELWAVAEARRFVGAMFGTFAACALLLAAVGFYGVLAYAVTQRNREFAVRMALGARAGDIARLVARDGLVMVLAGVGTGALVALWCGELLGYWLNGVTPTDVGALVVAEAVLFVTAAVAAFVPARRATRVDPVEMLRSG